MKRRQEKEQKLAKALRENLRKRKAQLRDRADTPQKQEDEI